MRLFLYIILIHQLTSFSLGQNVMYDNILHGGVVGNGGSTGFSAGSINFNLPIPSGSTIEKAFLIVSEEGKSTNEIIIELNGASYTFNSSTRYTNEFTTTQTSNYNYNNSSIHVKDITADINPNISAYTLTKPIQNNLTSGYYKDTYLYVVFINTNMPLLNTILILNNQDVSPYTQYNLSNLNPINNNNPVGLEVLSADFCDTIADGSFVRVNNYSIGLLGGQDITSPITCSSPFPSFAYYNNTLFGLGDDIPNSVMFATDATADINSYINNNDTSIDIEFEYQNPTDYNSNLTNPIRGVILNYTTSCDTFTTTLTPDTTICLGKTLQLQATGGSPTTTSNGYEWSAISNPSALNDLSCTDCPNPIFSGDSSQVYTVRIWNTDSCSVVKPISIGVSRPQEIDFSTLRSTCSYSTGKIIIQDSPDNVVQFGAVNKKGDTLTANSANTFNGLSAGDYTLFYIDKFGCSTDTVVTVAPVIDTKAAIATNPISGTAPIHINLQNNSVNATDYSWWLNGDYQGNQFSGFFTDTSGTFEIELIAWKTDSICADTVSFTVFIFDSLVATLPNVFTPNNDGVNDFFNVKVNLPVAYDLVILNRWGNVVFENGGDLTKGEHKLWNGETKSGEKVNDGTYFYKLVFELDRESIDCEITDCEVVKQGFVQVINN